MHAYIIHYLKKQMPYVIGKSEKQKKLLDRLDRCRTLLHQSYFFPFLLYFFLPFFLLSLLIWFSLYFSFIALSINSERLRFDVFVHHFLSPALSMIPLFHLATTTPSSFSSTTPYLPSCLVSSHPLPSHLPRHLLILESFPHPLTSPRHCP